jgi:hypothetical protein
MDIFVCPRCGHQFNRKYRLINHINRIFVCKPKILDIPVDIFKLYNGPNDDNRFINELQARSTELYEQYLLNQLSLIISKKAPVSPKKAPDTPKKAPDTPKKAPDTPKKVSDKAPVVSDINALGNLVKPIENISINLPKDCLRPTENNLDNNLTIIGKDKNRLACKYCNITFTTVNNRSRHELHRCKHRNNNVTTKNVVPNIVENKECNYNINNITNNTNSHNTNTNTNTINIQQNIYGEEKFHYITGDIENRLELLAASDSKKFFRELFKYAYFDPKHPENKTFKKDKVKAAYLLVLRSLPHNWEYEDKDTVFHDKLRQIFAWLELDSSINIDNTTVQKIVEDVTTDKEPISTQMRKQLENMENTNYTNKMEKQTNLLTVKFNNELDSYRQKIEKEIRLKYKKELEELEHYRSQIKK